MSPPYIFKIDEIREHPDITPATSHGHWIPSLRPGFNYRATTEGVSEMYWFCDRQRIRPVGTDILPKPLTHFKTFSVFFSGGRGFWILRGDGTNPVPGEAWHALRFDHGGVNHSSHLTPAGQEATMQWQRTDQGWAHMLLPDIYHGSSTQTPNCGGLTGELPIFLALAAMSMAPENLQQWLPYMFQNSQWNTHGLNNGRTHKRGVVVDVYTCPNSWANGSAEQDLIAFENGYTWGKYYN